jgi:site-specific DNA-adenine methylase
MPNNMTLAEIGAIEFLGSFNNGGFPRGYAKPTETRNYYQEAYRNLEKQAPLLKDIIFRPQNYWQLDPTLKNAVIYLDPPYANTKHYGYASQKPMNYQHFWNWVIEISKNNFVYISEQIAPSSFEIVWEQEVTRSTNKENNFKAVERLYKYKGE